MNPYWGPLGAAGEGRSHPQPPLGKTHSLTVWNQNQVCLHPPLPLSPPFSVFLEMETSLAHPCNISRQLGRGQVQICLLSYTTGLDRNSESGLRQKSRDAQAGLSCGLRHLVCCK